jgi:ABC-type molybdate transport system substrate-binding protein
LAAPTPSDAAEIKVLTSRAMNHVLTELGGTFERASGHKVTLVLAPPAEIQKRVENGEIVDVVMSGATVNNLVKQGKIAPGDRVVLAQVGIAWRSAQPRSPTSAPRSARTLLAAKCRHIRTRPSASQRYPFRK